MTFDVKKHLIRVQGGKEYLPVAARLVWFREEHPDWGIETRPIEVNIDKGYAVFEAFVYNAEGKLMATGTKMETARGFADYVEKAETGSIGRALAVCGYGTQFAPELEEGDRIVDSPLPIGEPFYAGSKSGSTGLTGAGSTGLTGAGSTGLTGAGSTGGSTECAECGREMTKGQYDYSVRAFGSAYCPSCQRQKVKK